MAIDFAAVADALEMEMEFRKGSPKQLAAVWGVSAMTIVNARKGKVLSTDLFMRVCIYLGVNPLSFWRNEAVSYEGVEQQVENKLGYPL